jgi:hypothetical protein
VSTDAVRQRGSVDGCSRSRNNHVERSKDDDDSKSNDISNDKATTTSQKSAPSTVTVATQDNRSPSRNNHHARDNVDADDDDKADEDDTAITDSQFDFLFFAATLKRYIEDGNLSDLKKELYGVKGVIGRVTREYKTKRANQEPSNLLELTQQRLRAAVGEEHWKNVEMLHEELQQQEPDKDKENTEPLVSYLDMTDDESDDNDQPNGII